MNQLFFGDNLDVLRESIKDESVDLIYLDPPFNSSANYNVLFSSPKGHQSESQIEAFEDTWHWGEEAEKEFVEILAQTNTQVAEVLRSLRQFLGENDMMAYLVMMTNRLLELHRVLKETGSLYLHCDPTASHYLKVVLDGVFGFENYRNEIIWERSKNPKGSQHKNFRWGPSTDTILYYAKSSSAPLNVDSAKSVASESALEDRFPNEDEIGRWADGPILCSDSMGPRPNLVYEYKGFTPGPSGWRVSLDKLRLIDDAGDLYWTAKQRPRRKLRPGPQELNPLSNCWTDIAPINSQAHERLGYPTQKPLVLLERMLRASSKEGDVILDPFCGCGTAVHAAQKLNRQWLGIDITHLAISLIEKRLRDSFPGIQFEVHGTPKDYEGAKNLAERDKYQFQWWACSLVNAQPYGGKKKGADGGVDGLIFFQDDVGVPKKIVVSVKGGEHVSVTMVKDLIATIIRQKAEIGLFVTLNPPTKPMIAEAASAGFYKSSAGGVFPKIQILEIEKLIEHHDEARYPHLDAGSLTFKKAAIEHGEDKQVDLFAAPAKGSKKKK